MAKKRALHKRMVCLHNIPSSTMFRTKNQELAIFGHTRREARNKLIALSDAYERGGIKGEYGIIDTYFSRKVQEPLTPKTIQDFNDFKDTFNNSSLTVDAAAEKFVDLDKRILDYARTCKNGEMTTKGFEASLQSMSHTAKIGQAALQAFATAGNMLIGFLISKVIQGAITIFDDWIHSVDNANEAMENAVSAYDSAKSNLEDINSQLETHQAALNSLLAKDKLTYAEEGQLEELREITRELLLQQDIEQRKTDAASKEAADKTVDAFQKQYRHDLSEEGLQEMLSPDSAPMTLDENDVIGNIASYVRAEELYEEAFQQYQNLKAIGKDTLWQADDVQSHKANMDDYAQALDGNLADLWNKLDTLKLEYNKAVVKQQNTPGLLTSSENDIISSYESIYDAIRMIYQYTRPEDWNELEFDKIFHTEGIEKTKEELAELVKTGELTPEMIAAFPNLSRAIEESALFLEKGQSAAEGFCEQLDALYGYTSYDNTRTQLMHSLGFGDTIDNAEEAKLWSSLSALGSEELFLDAYLRIRDQYGERPEGWTPQDWLAHIQTDLESRQLELHTQLSVPETLDRLDTRLKPALDSLKSAYQNIFTDDGFTLENVGVDMLRSISSSIDELNAMEGVDIQIDPSAFENFTRTLTDTASTADDVQDQFAALTGAIVHAAGSTEVNAGNFDVLARSLEEMGAVNAGDVLEEIMLAQQGFEAISEKLGLTLEDVAGATYQETVQMLQNAQSAGLNAQALWKLAVAQGTITDGTIATESNVAALLAEAQAAGLDTAMLTALRNVQNGNIKDTAAAQKIKEQAIQDIQASMADMTLDFDLSSTLGAKGTSAARDAGQAAGDAYADAFEKELEDLKTLRDRGTITEKAYLDEFRRLYQRYYRDKKKYAEEYAKYEHEYLQGMKSLYESALSGITSMLDRQIGSYEDQKSAAVDSLEAERDARIEVLEAQKEQYEEQIKLIDGQIEAREKIIDGINEEIDAIKDANGQRKREIDLEKSKYELERMMNQRTILQYSADKGMHYVQDTDGARDARQAVEDAELEIEIAGKEEQIKLVEKEIDLLEERKESINEQIDQLDVQIDQINKQYDRMIAETEQYWDTIIQGMEDYKSRWEELGEIEEQAKLTATLEQLGISTGDILNMSGEAFARFKEEYVGLLADIYRDNDTMLFGLSTAAGINVEALGSYLEATQQYIDGLNGLGEAISPVSDAIGAVTNALTGGGGSGGGQGTDGTDTGNGAGTGGLVGAMGSLKKATDDALGSGGQGDAESANGGDGAIGKFGQLEDAVTNVTAAVGGDTEEASGIPTADIKDNGADENGKGLIGSVNKLGETTETILGEPDGKGVTGRFRQLSDVIGQAERHVHDMLRGLHDIDGETFECTIKINVEMNGELPGAIGGSVSSKIKAGSYNFSNSASLDTPLPSGLSAQSAEAAVEAVAAYAMPADEAAAAYIMPAANAEPEISAFSPEPTHIAAETDAEPLLLPTEDSLLRPIGPGERAYELRKTFEPLLQKADESFEYLSGNAMITHTRLMEKMVRDITAANIITNNKNIQPNIRIGDIRITCPGVTSREVAAQVGTEVNRLFSGLHLYVEQQNTVR